MITLSLDEKKQVVYSIGELESQNTQETPPLTPQPRISNGHIMSYRQWLHEFGDELEGILSKYEDFVLDVCHKHKMICSMNHIAFRENMAKLIYNTSMNRYKYYSALI
jgi:hypothetical protein